ncbi:MAG: PLP-dependent aminotransferase family protein, partial [Candidatus Sumerlaeaceae bacterium]|nr:PLP-dependent aminotransferase family protein [Candidatus Sumerlaeaceae bacterium]
VFSQIFAEAAEGKKSLQYGSTIGYQDLRQVLARRLEGQGIAAPVDPNHIVVTSGSQQFLFLVTDVLVDPGDIVIVEDPTYFVYTGVLESAGARVMGVETDDDGIVPAALERRLGEIAAAGLLPRLKMLYVMTYYQNPKGTSHSWERRKQIYELIERFSTPENFVYILEDAAYVDLRYDGADIPFMKTLDPANERVILALTFSKGFAPGLRLGYAHVPAALVPHVLNQKGNHDFGSSNLAQHIAHRAMVTGLYDKQIEILRQRYSAKRDLMVSVIKSDFPAEVRYIEPRGGLYVWVTLPEGVATGPDSPLCAEAMRRKVLYVPGSYCYAQEPGITKPDNQLRLCYGFIDEEPMVEGMRRLAAAIKTCV